MFAGDFGLKFKLFDSKGLLVNIAVVIGVLVGFMLLESFVFHVLSWPPLNWTLGLMVDWAVPALVIAMLVVGLAGILFNAYCHLVLKKAGMRVVDEWQAKRNANNSDK